MNEDEQFAANLRPDSIFGGLGASDHFDDDNDGDFDDEYDFEDDVAGYGQAARAVGAAPMGVSGEPPAQSVGITTGPIAPNTGGDKLGAALTLFSIVGGGAIGWYFGRFKGAAGGALAGGSLRNLYRGQKLLRTGQPAEGIKMGGIGIAVLGVGGYLLWTANDRK